MTLGIERKQSLTRSPSSTAPVQQEAGPEATARTTLRAKVDATPDVVAARVAERVVGSPDQFETPAAAPSTGVHPPNTVAPSTEVPSTEPSAVNRAAANGFRDELHAIDDRESNPRASAAALRQGDLRTPNDMRAGVLTRIAEHAGSIDDPVERDRFVRAIAPDAGRAAGQYSDASPYSAYRRLDAIGQGVSPDTGRLLANSALQYGPANDNLVPQGRSGSPVGDAFAEVRQGRTERLGEVISGTARAIVPGVDAAAHLLNGDVSSAAASAAVDLAGGAIIRGGRLAVGAAAGAWAMAPEQAQAGVLGRMTLRFGDEAVEIQARTGLVNGRTRTFDVQVPGRFQDGTSGALRLADPRAKHNALSGLPDGNLSRVARRVSRGGTHEFSAARTAAQFSDRYNSVEGQAELARLVMARVTPTQLSRVGQPGGELTISLDRTIGLTPTRGGQVVPASSVRVMRNNDGAFHLVPMP